MRKRLRNPINVMSTSFTTRYAVHPQDAKSYDTAKLRAHFLVEELFKANHIELVYTMYDRLIVGGAYPSTKDLSLDTIDPLKADYFLERRELGIINVGDAATITVEGEKFELQPKEALYVGSGVKSVIFHPAASGNANFYINSAPAHTAYPTKKVSMEDAEKVELGSLENSNHRIINKLIVNSVVKSCQLQMGLTELKSGSVWNTMPAHTHDRRMEAYFYFELPEDEVVSHFMGEPSETRHLWVKNKQAVISPPWSIHSGAGTSNYTFIWGMAGENLDYGDMDKVAPKDLR